MNKTKVICLIGASGSGKTTVAKELEKIGYNIIQSYTTRPPREDGEWGHTFITNWEYDTKYGIFKGKILKDGYFNEHFETFNFKMIAYFNSYNSGHHYFATDEQVIRDKTNIYIVDSKGAEMVHEFYKGSSIEVITVYLQVDREVRRKRMINRGTPTLSQLRSGKTYSYQKLLKGVSERLTKDDKLFQTVKCDYVVDGNQDIDMVVDLVRDVI